MQPHSAEGAGRRKSDLLLMRMSHDIRTPMNSIVGLSHLCLQTDLSGRQREYLEKIQSAAVTLVEILSDVADFSHVESGRVELQSTPFRMADLLQRIADMVVVHRAERKGLEVLFRAAPDVPEYLEGDPQRIYQVLANLTSNAIRFTQRGEVIFSAALLERKGEALHLRFSIQDTGIGMGSEQVQRLGHFFSAPVACHASEMPPDIGLGLALAHMLIRLMGGVIHVESEAERGSTFHVSLWLKEGTAPRPRTVPLHLLRNMHVLVVDDNCSARLILSETLLSFGFRVECAESGPEALSLLQQACERRDPFTLVLLDWKMPEMDGVETARQITHNAAINTPPRLLMVSASTLKTYQRQGAEAGIRDFLIKPVTPSLLFDAIVRLFSVEKDGTDQAYLPAEAETARIEGLECLRDARILLVEDNDINQQIAAELLQQVGAATVTANNGQEALDILQEQRFDAVLMDIQMPIMDGLEAARRARDLPVPGIRGLPILAMTAHALASDREKSLKAGMQEHLTKPIEPRKLYASLAKWIRAAREAAAKGAQSGAVLPDGLGDLPGLSVQNALKNLGGNTGLYKRLLIRFVEGYDGLPRQVSDALAAGDQQLAVRLSHTLKGVAANLGAFDLASAAGDLEKALAAHEEHVSLLERVHDVLRRTIESIRGLIAAEPAPEAPVVRQEMSAERQAAIIDFLRDLPERMRSEWIAAQQQAKDFASLLGHSATASAYAALMQAVDDFDADAVQAQAEKIVALLREARG
ncbi:MAG: response regulator [Deltaproteobacteria bacterium]|jgi:CheY-like chemotaxis protein/HPt (histidine-containing phosphotransfer) domain-containing protein|nr:response regulator [Deltaproteobacteria bacterium]